MGAEARLDAELSRFRTLAERALTLRADTIKYGVALRQRLDQKQPVTGEDIAILNKGINDHLSVRKDLMEIVEAYEDWMNIPDRELAARGLSQENRLTGVMLSLGSALVLYDNYLLAVSLFERDGKLRRILNERDPGYSVARSALAKVTLTYDSSRNRKKARKAVRFFEKEWPRFEKTINRTQGHEYLRMVIVQSPSYSMVNQRASGNLLGRKVNFFTGATTDSMHELERGGFSFLSMVFGNSVGLVESRKGKLFNRGSIREEVARSLWAGDILLEKTPFRLTDKLIPGFWGHAAVWVGTEAELKDLGIWNDPLVVQYQTQIREGRRVVEALRSGVEMNTLDRFLNIDSLGVLRKPGMDKEARAKVVLQALRQVGKSYDFNFDVESKEKVFCTKLIYLSYTGIEWPTKKSMGRTTFSPDDVALKAVKGNILEVVTLYHDGLRVQDAPVERMAELIRMAN